MNIKVPFTTAQKIIDVISILIILFLFGFLIFNWANIPDRIPSHFDATGAANAWSSKGSILIMPIVSVVLYSFITVISFFPAIWNTPVRITEDNYIFVYQNIRYIISYTKLLLVSVFAYLSICTATQGSLGVWFLPVFLVLMFVPIIFFIVKIVRGSR